MARLQTNSPSGCWKKHEILPNSIRILKGHLEDSNLAEQQTLDGEIKFNLMIINSSLTLPRIYGDQFAPYLEDLKEILRKTLHVKDKEVTSRSRIILENLLKGLLGINIPGDGIMYDGRDTSLQNFHPYRVSQLTRTILACDIGDDV